jgi:hypothetical protein
MSLCIAGLTSKDFQNIKRKKRSIQFEIVKIRFLLLRRDRFWFLWSACPSKKVLDGMQQQQEKTQKKC